MDDGAAAAAVTGWRSPTAVLVQEGEGGGFRGLGD
jgi:hypothetical protein